MGRVAISYLVFMIKIQKIFNINLGGELESRDNVIDNAYKIIGNNRLR